MDIFKKLFSQKSNPVGIAAREEIARKFREITKNAGVKNFTFTVGDDHGNYIDSLIIISLKENNPELAEWLPSLLEAKTRENLKSVGLTKIGILSVELNSLKFIDL
jgi:hypothetical protein